MKVAPAHPRPDPIPAVVIWGFAVVAATAILNWLSAQLAWLLASGHRLPRPLTSAPAALLLLRRHLSEPASAWQVASRPLPEPATYYAAAALVLLASTCAALAARHLARRTRRVSAWPYRRRLERRGADWASSTELRALKVRGSGEPGRLVLGRTHGFPTGKLVASEAQHSVLVLGPTQSGKTSGLAVPALLEWTGPAVATSVKDDLARNTLPWRSRQGPVRLFDPSGTSGLSPLSRWSPLALCRDWAGAQRTASWLVDATPGRSGMADAAFWYSAAAKQLSPLLLAASCGGWSMIEVVRWTNTGDFVEPSEALLIAGETDAAAALSACASRDDRIRSSVGTTLETVLAPFEDPTVAAWTSANDFEVGDVLDRGTLYLCGPGHEQNRVQGVFSALVSSVLAAGAERVARSGRPLNPPLLVVLDEAANIAPIRDLDTVASTCAGLGIQLVTVCQDLGQLSSRYGPDRSRTIVNNHRAKLLLSGVSDLQTLDLMSGLAGEAAIREESLSVDQTDGRRTRSSAVAFRRLLPSDELRRVSPGEGVLIYGHLAPIRLRLRPWFADLELCRRAASNQA